MRNIPALAWLALILSVCVSVAATGDRIITVTQPQFARYSTARQKEINGKLATARFVAYSTAHQLTVGPQGPQGERGFRGYSGATGPAGTFSRPATFSNISTHASAIPSGGTTGQKLVKNSNTSYDTRWETDTDLALSDTNPVMAGTAAPGTGTTASRTDHVHPSDTSRLTVARFSTYSASRQAQFGTVLPLTGGTLTGNTLVKPSSNSTTAFQVQKSDATSVFNVDTTNGRVGIGTASPGAALDMAFSLASDAGIKIKNSSTATGTVSAIVDLYTSTNSRGALFKAGTNYTTYKTISANYLGFYNDVSGDISVLNDYSAGKIQLTAGGSTTPHLVVGATGNIGLGNTAPTAKLHITGDTLRLDTAKTPASAAATCNAGDITWDASYFYICIAANTWHRAAHATWP